MGFLDTIGSWLDPIGKAVGIGSNILGMGMAKKQQDQSSLAYRVGEAKALGIHPLAALGINPASGPSVGAFSQMGQNIQETLSNDRRIANDLGRAQIDETKAKAEYWRAKAHETVSGQSSPAVSGSGSNSSLGITGQNTSVSGAPPGVQFTDVQVPVSKSVGTRAGTDPLELQAVTKYGTVYRLPTQATQESISEGSLFTQIKYNLGQIADYLAGYGAVMFPKALKETRSYLLSDRPRSGGNGKEFRYNVFRGSWVLRNIGSEGPQIWDHKALWKIIRLPHSRK